MHNCQDPHLLGWQKLKLTDKLLRQVVLGCFTRLGLEQIEVAKLCPRPLTRSHHYLLRDAFPTGCSGVRGGQNKQAKGLKG